MNTLHTLILSITGFILLPLDTAQAQGGGYGWHMGPGMMGGWGMGWFGGIFMMAIWGLVIAALVILIRWLLRATQRTGYRSQEGNNALEILIARYAKGEIDKAEFEEKKHDIKNE